MNKEAKHLWRKYTFSKKINVHFHWQIQYILPDLRNALQLTLQAWYEMWNVMWEEEKKQIKITDNNSYEHNKFHSFQITFLL